MCTVFQSILLIQVQGVAITERELEEPLNGRETICNNCNISINIGKTKNIACRTKSGKNKRLGIKIGNEKIGEIR